MKEVEYEHICTEDGFNIPEWSCYYYYNIGAMFTVKNFELFMRGEYIQPSKHTLWVKTNDILHPPCKYKFQYKYEINSHLIPYCTNKMFAYNNKADGFDSDKFTYIKYWLLEEYNHYVYSTKNPHRLTKAECGESEAGGFIEFLNEHHFVYHNVRDLEFIDFVKYYHECIEHDFMDMCVLNLNVLSKNIFRNGKAVNESNALRTCKYFNDDKVSLIINKLNKQIYEARKW